MSERFACSMLGSKTLNQIKYSNLHILYKSYIISLKYKVLNEMNIMVVQKKK